MRLKPFFPYYGSKFRDAKRYPPPAHSLTVEPFAGSAGYATWWMPPRVTLIDSDPIIAGLWRYLIAVSPAEVLALPDLEVGQSVDDFPQLPQEARWLIGFWLNRGSATPKKTKTAYSARTDRSQLIWSARARERIAAQVEYIRHWRVHEVSYLDLNNPHATWFIDPPYCNKGVYYRHHTISYPQLGKWCLGRRGQIIVCEQDGATWLPGFPFEPLATIKSTRGTSKEVVWIGHSSRPATLVSAP